MEACPALGIECALPGAEFLRASSAQFHYHGNADFKSLSKLKSRNVLEVLLRGYNVLLVDGDIVFLRDPLPHLRRGLLHHELQIQSDSPYGVSKEAYLVRGSECSTWRHTLTWHGMAELWILLHRRHEANDHVPSCALGVRHGWSREHERAVCLCAPYVLHHPTFDCQLQELPTDPTQWTTWCSRRGCRALHSAASTWGWTSSATVGPTSYPTLRKASTDLDQIPPSAHRCHPCCGHQDLTNSHTYPDQALLFGALQLDLRDQQAQGAFVLISVPHKD